MTIQDYLLVMGLQILWKTLKFESPRHWLTTVPHPLQGTRPLLLEVQALCSPTHQVGPRLYISYT